MVKFPSLLPFAVAAVLFPAPARAGDTFGGSTVAEVIQIRLDRGDLILESVMDAIRKHDIQDGAFDFGGGIGAGVHVSRGHHAR